jgi:hypothetical protein
VSTEKRKRGEDARALPISELARRTIRPKRAFEPRVMTHTRTYARAAVRQRWVLLGADILWDARAPLKVDGRWARHINSAWEDNSSILQPTLILR